MSDARKWVGLSLLLGGLACGGGAAVSTDDGAAEAGATGALSTLTMKVHYPAGLGHRITLHCGGAGLNWNTTIETRWTAGDVWVGTVKGGADAQCKPLFDDSTWAVGPNWALTTRSTEAWPFFFHQGGRIEQVAAFHSRVLAKDRRIWVYLPPSYDENSAERFPVVYLQDGQNLFYDETSFAGVSWNVGGAMDQGARDGTVHEAIVVGIDSDASRLGELTPVADPDYGGGQAAGYLSFLLTELKPAIDAAYHTLPDAAHTLVGGSSLGGLFALWAGLTRPDAFSAVLALSPSTWWDSEWITAQTTSSTGPWPARVYVDSGDSGPSQDGLTPTASLAAAWKRKGRVSVKYVVQAGASHNELYWRARVPGALAFGLGPR